MSQQSSTFNARKALLIAFFLAFFSILSLYSQILTQIVFAQNSQTPTPKPKTQVAPTKKPTATKAPVASPEPSASPTATNEEQTTQNLKNRIDRVIEQRREEVKGMVDQIGSEKRAIVGEIQRVTEKTITIRNKNGSHTYTITSDIILVKDNKKISLDDVAVGDWAMALGYFDTDKNEFTLKRFVVSPSSLARKKFDIITGVVKSFARNQLVVTIKKDNKDITFPVKKDTAFQDHQGKPLDQKEIKAGRSFLIVSPSEENQESITVARSLSVIESAEPAPSEEAAVSPSPSPASRGNTRATPRPANPKPTATPAP